MLNDRRRARKRGPSGAVLFAPRIIPAIRCRTPRGLSWPRLCERTPGKHESTRFTSGGGGIATMSDDANCALVRRFIEEVFNAGKFDGVAEILNADYVHHDPTTQEFGSGIEGFKRLIGYYREAFPDLTI